MHRRFFTFCLSPTAQAIGFILGAFVISLTTLSPVEYLPPTPGSDKLHHVIGFGGWALMCAFGPAQRFLYMALFILFWGGMIELIQPYVNRYGEWLDFYADALGVILVMVGKLSWLTYRFKQKTKTKTKLDESIEKT